MSAEGARRQQQGQTADRSLTDLCSVADECSAEQVETARDEAVVDPAPIPAALHEATLAEHFQMMAHGGLGDAQRLDEVTGRACLTSCSEQADQSQACRIGEDGKPTGKLLSAYLSDRPDADRRAWFGHGSRHRQRQYLSESSGDTIWTKPWVTPVT